MGQVKEANKSLSSILERITDGFYSSIENGDILTSTSMGLR